LVITVTNATAGSGETPTTDGIEQDNHTQSA